jgi:hypothetical protein
MIVAPEVLTDGLNGTGENLKGCEEREITLCSPVSGVEPHESAKRDASWQPVAAERLDQLPTYVANGGRLYDNTAFLYVVETNDNWCPAGQRLAHTESSSDPGRPS